MKLRKNLVLAAAGLFLFVGCYEAGGAPTEDAVRTAAASVSDDDAAQVSAPFELSRFTGNLTDSPDVPYKPDLMYITKGTTSGGTDYAFYTFGDTFKDPEYADTFFGNTVGVSTDFDLSDATTYRNRVNAYGAVAQGMTPMSQLSPPPGAPDANEDQIWFSRSFFLGQDLYTYYGSKKLGTNGSYGGGLAVLRGGVTDEQLATGQFGEFERIPKAQFWTNFWFDGDPIIKTESDGTTYLYLFNQFGLQRTLFTKDGVENFSNYKIWNGTTWVPTTTPGAGVPMWPGVLGAPGDAALRATCQWNPHLNKWLAIYARFTSSDGKNGQLAYRTADELTGPWGPQKIFYHGTTLPPPGPPPNSGDYYSPVHVPAFDRNGGKTVYIVASRYGSHGPIGIFEHNFDYTVTTKRVGPIAEFAPHGLDATVHINTNGNSLFFFPETGRYDSAGTLRRMYPNAFLATADADASDGFTFDVGPRYRPLRNASSESAAWITAAAEFPGTYNGRRPIGAFFEALDEDGFSLGKGFAIAKGSSKGVSRFRRATGYLPDGSLAGKASGFLPGSYTKVVLSDHATGNVYLGNSNASGASDLGNYAQQFVDESKYTYFTATPVSDGLTNRSWSNDESLAMPIFEGASNPSLFQNEFTGNWISIYTVPSSSAGENSQVAMRTAQTVDGPWTEPVVLFSADNSSGSQGRLYNATYLSGLDQDGGKVIYFYASDFQTGTVNLFEVRLGE